MSPRLLLVLSAAAFGGTWVAAPWAVAEIPPLAVAYMRFTIAALLLLAWCRYRGLRIDPRLADLPVILGVAATSVVGYNVLFLYGVQLAPPSHGAVIVPGTIPVITLVMARLFLGERPRPRQGVGALVALVGLALVIGPAFAAGSDEIAGDLLFLGGALAWSVYTIIGRAATRRFDVAIITFLAALVGALTFFALSLTFEVPQLVSMQPSLQAVGGIVYLGSLGTVISFVFFYLGVQRLGAARAAAYTVLIPLFGVASTIVLLGETLEPLAIAGAALTIGGLWLMQAPPSTTAVAAEREATGA